MEQASEGNILIYQAEGGSAMLDGHHPLRADLPAATTLRRRPADRAARATRGGMLPTPEEARAAMARLKAGLIARAKRPNSSRVSATTPSRHYSASSTRPSSANPPIPTSRQRLLTGCDS